MKFEQLRLKNFRQFYGEQSLEFSTDESNNVTIIHGSNGSGKSTILNALLWVFYKDINLPKSHDLASERAVAEADYGDAVTVEVKIEFTHEGEEYVAIRSEKYQKKSEGGMITESKDSEITLTVSGKRRKNPEVILRRILPERLKELFLFHGENIDELSEEDNQDQIKEAIKNIMGLEILERSTKHLKDVSRKFRKEVQERGDEDINSLIQQLENLEEKRDEKESELESVKERLSEIDGKLKDIEEELAELQGLEGIKDRKDDLEKQKSNIEGDIEDINDDIKSDISEDGYLVFAVKAVRETVESLQELETQTEKEEDGEEEERVEIAKDVVESILDDEECICGRDLEQGAAPYREVEDLISEAVEKESQTRNEVEKMRDKSSDELKGIIQDRRSLFESTTNKKERRKKLRKRIHGPGGIKEELDEIKEKLSEGDTERIDELNDEKERLSDEEDKHDRKQGKLESKIKNITEEIEEKQKEIEQKKAKKEEVELAKRRQKVAKEAKKSLEEVFEGYQDTVREAVNKRVNEVFRDIIAKDYYVEITENYSMKVKKDVGTESSVDVAKSTGERQVASLSFIASLIQIAKERYESEEDASYFTGGIYPIVMDSPFGYLDPEYQRKVSKIMPKMSDQVIVLVTDSQWTDEVRDEMEDIIGREYRLDYHNPGENDAEYEQTEIKPERADIKRGV